MTIAVTSSVGALEMEEEGAENVVEFAAQVEFIRGHLAQAVANKNNNEIDLAIAHAGHPVAEHFGVIAPVIMKHDQSLYGELQTSLDQLPGLVQTLDSPDFKKEVDRIDALLDSAVKSLVPESMMDDTKFWIKVAMELLETAEHEYEEAVHEGMIEEMVEYQDAQAFIARAEAIFNNVASKIDEHEREEFETFFADLKQAIESKQDPEQVETFINGIINEFREVAGLEHEMTGKPSVANIKTLLESAEFQYGEGHYDIAEQMAIKAYLDNYEFLEADIEAKDPELMESIEIMLREELRRLIKEHASIEQIEAKIAEINSNLDKVLALGIGLAEEVVGDPRLVYVDNIRMLLDKAVEEYEEGEYEEAWSFAVKAYLDNYEFLEHDVEEQNEELNDEVERMLRDELQQKINDRAPVSEVKELAREISAKLDAVEVIVPEFPVGLALVMTSIVGITVAMTRAKKFGQGRRSFFLLVLHSQKITRITADALRSY
jgi:hypothetical protein